MRRIALAALVSATPALAMPSDLPWQPFSCDAGKTLDLRLLSDGLSIGVRLNDEDTSNIELTRPVLPVIDALQAQGFFKDPNAALSIKDGSYTGEGDTLLEFKEGIATLTGTTVPGAPYVACRLVSPPAPPP